MHQATILQGAVMTIQGGVREICARGFPFRGQRTFVHALPTVLTRRQRILLQFPSLLIHQKQLQATAQRLSRQNKGGNIHKCVIYLS